MNDEGNLLQAGLEMFRAGGMIMWMLGAVAFILYVTAVAALLFVMRGNLGERDAAQWPQWIDDPSQARGRMGEALRYALHGPRLTAKVVHRRFDEVRLNLLAAIDRRLLVVNTLVAAAPLAGLLGTVMGMLGMFAGLSQGKGAAGMQRVASGMQEALITTQTGLTIALPGLFIALIVKSKRNGIAAALTRLESLVLTTLFQRSNPA
jgi:biopolymer transport protein ExbB